MKIGLFLHPRISSLSKELSSLTDFLIKSGQEIVVLDTLPEDIFKNFSCISYCSFKKMPNKVDALFSIGGDGTFLRAARTMARTGKPVLGIHLGGLGFLADVSMNDYKEKLTVFFEGNYKIENRGVLGAKVTFKNYSKSYFALNDFVIDKGRVLKMIQIRTFVDDDYLNTYRCDGLIISTPTGSTAYSLSAGGPIVVPKLNVITISPICPHSLSARPVVISADQKIRIDCHKLNSDVSLVMDGQQHVPLKNASYVKIEKADFTIPIIRFDRDSFFQTLRTKMNWGRDTRGN